MRVEKNFMLIADPNTETDLSKTDLAYLHNLPSTRTCEYLEDGGMSTIISSNMHQIQVVNYIHKYLADCGGV